MNPVAVAPNGPRLWRPGITRGLAATSVGGSPGAATFTRQLPSSMRCVHATFPPASAASPTPGGKTGTSVRSRPCTNLATVTGGAASALAAMHSTSATTTATLLMLTTTRAMKASCSVTDLAQEPEERGVHLVGALLLHPVPRALDLHDR